MESCDTKSGESLWCTPDQGVSRSQSREFEACVSCYASPILDGKSLFIQRSISIEILLFRVLLPTKQDAELPCCSSARGRISFRSELKSVTSPASISYQIYQNFIPPLAFSQLYRAMASSLKSFLSRLTPNQSSANLSTTTDCFVKAQKPTELFPKPDPAVDGEDCLHDCSTCTISYPSKWSIDEEEEVYGHIKGWQTHLLVATGKTDWVRDVAGG